eukprot:11181105-Lingulodinium_polyedra.AAC.1
MWYLHFHDLGVPLHRDDAARSACDINDFCWPKPAGCVLAGRLLVEARLFADLEIQLLSCHGGTYVERPAQTGSR